MRFGKQLAPIIAFSALALFGSLAVSGCCAAKQATAPVDEPAAEFVPATPPATSGEDGALVDDCDSYSPRACCLAESPECRACMVDGAAEHQAWVERCPHLQPLPAIDCSQPAPVTACCLAMLPSCLRCMERGKAIDAAYRAACGDGAGAVEATP